VDRCAQSRGRSGFRGFTETLLSESAQEVHVLTRPRGDLVKRSGELHARLSEAEPRVRPGDALPSGRHDPDRRCADVPSTQGTHRRRMMPSTSMRTNAASSVPSGLFTWSSIGASLAASRLMSAAAARAATASSNRPVTSTMRRSQKCSWSQGEFCPPRGPPARFIAGAWPLRSPRAEVSVRSQARREHHRVDVAMGEASVT
jgi:hypothetical protein